MPNKPQRPHVATNLARQAGKTITAIRSADNASADILGQRLGALEAEVSWQEAGSPEAALFQLGVANLVLNRLTADGGDVDQLLHEATRLLHNLACYVERESGLRRTDFGFDYYLDATVARRSFGQVV